MEADQENHFIGPLTALYGGQDVSWPRLAAGASGRPDPADLILLVEAIGIVHISNGEVKASSQKIASVTGLTPSQIDFVWRKFSRERSARICLERGASNANTRALAREICQRLSFSADLAPTVGGLDFQSLRHAGDIESKKSVAGMLTKVPGIPSVFSAINKLEKVKNASQRVKISRHQLPELQGIWAECLDRAGIQEDRPLYIDNLGWGSRLTGTEDGGVAIGGLAASLSERTELLFLMGHTVGHVLLGQQDMTMLAENSEMIKSLVTNATLGLGGLLSGGLDVALKLWARRTMLSCDRIGLLVSQDVHASIRFLMKSAGVPVRLYGQMNIDAFLEQAGASDFASLTAEKTISALLVYESQSPWPIYRAAELYRWVKEGGYGEVLDRMKGFALKLATARQYLVAGS